MCACSATTLFCELIFFFESRGVFNLVLHLVLRIKICEKSIYSVELFCVRIVKHCFAFFYCGG